MARTGRLAPSLLAGWIDSLQATTCYLGLASADPFSVGDPLTLEPGGSVYTRAPVVWLRSGTLLRNRDSVSFLGLPAGTTIQSVVGFSAATNGTLLFSAPVARVDLPSGGYYDLDAEALLVGF